MQPCRRIKLLSAKSYWDGSGTTRPSVNLILYGYFFFRLAFVIGTISNNFSINNMNVPNNRVRIYYVKFGLGLEYDNEWIINTESSSMLSAINESLPEVNFSVTLKNEDQRFNVDNPASEINFLETGQKISVMYGYEVNEGNIEWMQLHSLMVSEWSANDTQATIKAVDRFKFMSDNYYKGKYYENGISLYDLAELVFVDAGIESVDYYLDSYLNEVVVHNPFWRLSKKIR